MRAQHQSLEDLGLRLKKAKDDMRLISGTSERLHSDIDRQTKSLTVLADSCGRFNYATLAELSHRISNLKGTMEEARRQFDEWESRRKNITANITEIRMNDPHWCDLVRRKTDSSSDIKEMVKPAHDEAVKLERRARESHRNATEVMRKQTERETWLRKRKSELEIEQPKLEIELSLKDELIVNITRKQVELDTDLKRLEPLVLESEANFTVWNATLIALETDSRRVNSTLQSYTATAGLDYNTTNPFKVLFRNYSKELNATFYQLTFAKEGLSNSTRRVAELTDEFRRAEAQYVEKQHELEEYTRKVEAGLIPRVDFKFEF
jgi:chromosome segregation ATPase